MNEFDDDSPLEQSWRRSGKGADDRLVAAWSAAVRRELAVESRRKENRFYMVIAATLLFCMHLSLIASLCSSLGSPVEIVEMDKAPGVSPPGWRQVLDELDGNRRRSAP